MLVGLLPLPLTAQSFWDALQGMLLGESSSCRHWPHLPCAAELCWPRPRRCRWSHSRLWAQEPLRQMLQASSLEPQIPNWLPAVPQAAPSSPCAFLGGCSIIPHSCPGSPQAAWAWDSRALNPPERAGHTQPQNPYFSMSLLLFCLCSSCAAWEHWGFSRLSNLWPISGNVSVCRAVSLGNFCCVLPLPHNPSFFSPEASQSCAVLQLKCVTTHRIPWDAESRFVTSWQG